MSTLVIPCPHCARPSQIDSARLPDKPAYFPCPHCNGRVVVDKRTLAAEVQSPVPAPATPTPPSAQAPAATPDFVPPTVEPTVPDRRFTEVPANAIFPSGIIVGEDEATIERVREAMAALGSEIDRVESVDAARQMIVNEQPELCIYVGGTIDGLPHAPMAPLKRLHPGVRRRLYLMLVADNLKTFDGNAAFMHEVNLVLSTQDVPRIGAALHTGLEYHKRLYKAYVEAVGQSVLF